MWTVFLSDRPSRPCRSIVSLSKMISSVSDICKGGGAVWLRNVSWGAVGDGVSVCLLSSSLIGDGSAV